MEIINLNNSFVLDSGPTNTIFVVEGDFAVLFDTCLTKDNAKKIDKLIGMAVSKVINTHSHADHIGGNRYFQEKYNCPIFIHPKEMTFCLMPELESSVLYGGAPFSAATGKFLCAPPVANVFSVEDSGIKFVELPGHSPGMTGFVTDDIFFMGDALFSEENIKKHKLLYLYDVESFLNSLGKIPEIDFKYGVFCHKGILEKENILNIININILHTEKIMGLISDVLSENQNITAEDITVKIMEKLEINFQVESFLLNSSTIKGYLRYMEKSHKALFKMDGGIKWSAL